jgi:hypothetical protein
MIDITSPMAAGDLKPIEALIWLDNRQIILYLQSLKNSIPKFPYT